MALEHTKGNRSPSLTYTISIDGVVFDLTGSTVKFKMRAEDSETLKVDADATIVTPPGVDGAIRYDWEALDVDTAGDFLGWFEVTLPSGKTQDTPEFEITFVDHVPAEPGLNARALLTIREARSYAWRDENDDSRDDILVDAINFVSDEIWDECHREFADTTIPARSGADGVTDGSTTFTSATASFTAADEGSLILIATKGYYRIVTVTNGTDVELDGSPSADIDLSWSFGEQRAIAVGQRGLVDLSPYDLLEIDGIVLYSDQATAVQRTLTSDEYKLLPVGRARGGTYLRLRTIAPAISELQPGFGWEAAITGFWGMSAIPDSVKFAAQMWLKNVVENPGAYSTATMSGYTVVPDVDVIDTGTAVRAGMPRSVRHRLARWKRGGLVA